jgi:hypothetical protein
MKPFSWSTMPLIVFLSSSISPCTSTETFLLRSPSATAPITRCISFDGRTRSSIRLLTDSMQSPQTRSVPLNDARWESFPSLPTTRLTRCSSVANAWFALMISFSPSAILPSMPIQCTGMRAVKSPAFTSLNTRSRTAGSKASAVADPFFACASMEAPQSMRRRSRGRDRLGRQMHPPTPRTSPYSLRSPLAYTNGGSFRQIYERTIAWTGSRRLR